MNIQVPPPSTHSNLTMKTPITVVNGFLGSGKTTIISHLLEQLKHPEKVVYIKNEQGEVSIDGLLVNQESPVKTKELLNGCVCCTLVGPLLETIDEIVHQQQPERIILESSGTAEPANLAVSLNGSQTAFREGMVMVVDVVNYQKEEIYHDHYNIQAKLTDLIILNKAELVDQHQLDQVKDKIQLMNNYSPVMIAQEGFVSKDLVFGLTPHNLERYQIIHDQHQHAIDTVSINLDQIFSKDALEAWLDSLPDEVIRVKGVVICTEGNLIVNQAYKRRSWYAVEKYKGDPLLYFTGKNLNQYKPVWETELKNLST